MKNEKEVTIVAVGDIMMGDHPSRIGHGVRSTIKNKGCYYLFEEVRPFLKDNDIVFGNIEAILSDFDLNPHSLNSMQLRGSPSSINGLKYAGFNILNLANNHALDHGFSALEITSNLIKNNGILTLGDKKDFDYLTVTIKGVVIGIISFNSIPSKNN